MKLILQNGYPYPYPENLTEQEQADISEAAAGHRLELQGVCHFQCLHTLTVEFKTPEAYTQARDLTGWTAWDDCTLEAPTSSADGYGHPAIIAGDMAYCGFIILAD